MDTKTATGGDFAAKRRRGRTKRQKEGPAFSEDESPELIDRVAEYFCSGMKPSDITAALKKDHRIVVNREAPWRLLQVAARNGWFEYRAQAMADFKESLLNANTGLEGVEVVFADSFKVVAERAANMLLDLIRQTAKTEKTQQVAIGVAGGLSVATVLKVLADLLSNPYLRGLPKELVFHNLCAAEDSEYMMAQPIASFGMLASRELAVDARFVQLHAPAVITPKLMKELKQLPEVERAIKAVDNIHIFLTSAGLLGDQHSMLKRYHKDAHDLKYLAQEQCIGDLMWLPINASGEPVPMDGLRYRVMTALDLDALQGRVQLGRKVLLALGRCRVCGMRKSGILDALLSNPDRRLVTHLCADYASVKAMSILQNGDSSTTDMGR